MPIPTNYRIVPSRERVGKDKDPVQFHMWCRDHHGYFTLYLGAMLTVKDAYKFIALRESNLGLGRDGSTAITMKGHAA